MDKETTSYQWIVAWILVICLAALAAQTEIGYTIIYYGIILLIVFLLVTQWQFISNAVAPIAQHVPTTA